MTPAMLERARAAARRQGLANVEFHEATIDKLPLPDASADCVLSNCVINLAPDKRAVFREMARVLKPGGRLAISDIALKQPLPAEIGDDVLAYVDCIAGAVAIEEYRDGLMDAGFARVEVLDSGADLNAYARIEGQVGCCGGEMAGRTVADMPASCCEPTPAPSKGETPELISGLAALTRRYDINDYAASVKVFAVKP